MNPIALIIAWTVLLGTSAATGDRIARAIFRKLHGKPVGTPRLGDLAFEALSSAACSVIISTATWGS